MLQPIQEEHPSRGRSIDDLDLEVATVNQSDYASERAREFKENFSVLERGINTRILGGGPIYPIPTDDERLSYKTNPSDITTGEYKRRYRSNLRNVWNDAMEMKKKGSFSSLAESRMKG